MLQIRCRGTLAASMTVASLAASRLAAQAPDSPVMFRQDAAHSGVSEAPLFTGQGGVRWRVATGGAVRSSPAVTATHLFVGSDDGSLYAVDRRAGTVTWKFEAGGPVAASPAVAGGLVVAATLHGRIFAVERTTGALRWSVATGVALPPNTAPAGGWDMLASSPVVVGRTVVIGAPDGAVRALDLASGQVLWTAQTGGKVRSSPAVHDGLVVVGSWDGRVYALDLKTGDTRWVHRTIGDTIDSKAAGYDRRALQSSPAIAGGMVFIGSRDGGLYGLDAATGERRWRASHRGSWVVASPAVKGDRVYVGSSDGHFIQAVEAATGREVWRLQTEANVLSSPLLAGGLLVVGTHRADAPWGDLLAIDPADGTVRWRLRLDETALSSPTAYDDELYVGTDAGTVVAVHEVSRVIPHLAVFYDSTLVGEQFSAGTRLAFEYFRQQGYEALDAGALAHFLAARLADGAPSVVVFAQDILPATVAPVNADTVLLMRYLRAGGKVVAFSAPLGSAVRDSTGRVLGDDPKGMEGLLGVPAASLDYDQEASTPTAAGRRWGLGRIFRGDYPVDPKAVTDVLAADEHGGATAWVRSYAAGRSGMGYVQLWGLGADVERLPFIRAAAEYGLLRAAGPDSTASTPR
jgi:eukaryotic-like serine/threonine-protein kinase